MASRGLGGLRGGIRDCCYVCCLLVVVVFCGGGSGGVLWAEGERKGYVYREKEEVEKGEWRSQSMEVVV